MKLFINIVIIVAIIAIAIFLLIKTFQRGKQGKCAACDYDCEIKKQLAKAKK
ncbi:FeoB-associated Cys-rich membrane protein [Limosilactobacillus sp. STM2_1]|uniref:FeoB-associated Cys-rich membrane protein n=1 Tax=Limosilactobacillus rudii TaxID=2759755 RepID=A0A7W3UK09_9LACO|nr:FeoB-associated Cys-rich membrane protein [Limosilactobacillus rudii]MBB1079143.1 FeoB-associated Cys-rich membrane protein [Limosilactobacillus rudii]MBB1096982.1 FeoB-associated Cys-rich membrane protein [Limosilactobacillus rudii]MCD7133950.1 FeoB-associated Cys-rich membrane protein [Limosilactobacillus rudii]